MSEPSLRAEVKILDGKLERLTAQLTAARADNTEILAAVREWQNCHTCYVHDPCPSRQKLNELMDRPR